MTQQTRKPTTLHMTDAAHMNRFKAVLFDLDGTLVDSAPDLGAAADAMRIQRGMASLPLAQYRAVAGAGARGLLGVAFGMTPDHAEFAAYKEEFFSNYELALTERTQVFEGVPSLMDALTGKGLLWGVVTNKASRFALPLTQAMPLFLTSRVLVCGDTTPHAKPHPAPLLEAAKRLGVAPQQCVYVGDDERDIVAGRAAGMFTVAAAYGYLGVHTPVQDWHADALIQSPDQLLQALGI